MAFVDFLDNKDGVDALMDTFVDMFEDTSFPFGGIDDSPDFYERPSPLLQPLADLFQLKRHHECWLGGDWWDHHTPMGQN